MKAFIRNLSAPAEFFLMVAVCFWWSVIGSARQVVAHLTHTVRSESITNSVVLRVVLLHLIVLVFAFWIGRIRGWSLAFGSRPSWKQTGAGMLLFIGAVLAILCSVILTNIIAPGARSPAQGVQGVAVSGLTAPFIVLFSVVNPVYEEVLGTGYFIHALQRFGMLPAVFASAIFRAFLHSYQGLDAWLIVLPLGLVFGFFYWRWRQLWPLIVAHVIFDLWSLFALTHRG
jgi:membrane protease YdiL (CAAX protease family)